MPDDYTSDLVGPYQAEDGTLRYDRFTPICDFCNGDPKDYPIEWSYDASEMSIELGGLFSMSDDAWAACEGCHELIEKRDWDELAERCLKIQTARFGDLLPVPNAWELTKIALIDHFKKFDDHRIGEAIPEAEFDPRTGKRKEQ